MKKMIKIALVGIAALNLVLLTGCGTVAGMGKDIQSGGKVIQKAASRDKK